MWCTLRNCAQTEHLLFLDGQGRFWCVRNYAHTEHVLYPVGGSLTSAGASMSGAAMQACYLTAALRQVWFVLREAGSCLVWNHVGYGRVPPVASWLILGEALTAQPYALCFFGARYLSGQRRKIRAAWLELGVSPTLLGGQDTPIAFFGGHLYSPCSALVSPGPGVGVPGISRYFNLKKQNGVECRSNGIGYLGLLMGNSCHNSHYR